MADKEPELTEEQKAYRYQDTDLEPTPVPKEPMAEIQAKAEAEATKETDKEPKKG